MGEEQPRASGGETSSTESRQPLPLTLLTGFLGAGKTTALNHILRHSKPDARIGALVNELGAVGIDKTLLRNPNPNLAQTGNLVELANGCICCTIDSSLRDALEKILERRNSLDALLLETSGASDPAPIIETIRLFAPRIRLDAVVTVADAAAFVSAREGSLPASWPASWAATVRSQLANADVLLLNKVDLLVQRDDLEDATAAIRALGGSCRVLACSQGRAPPELILGGEPLRARGAATMGGAGQVGGAGLLQRLAPWAAARRAAHSVHAAFRSVVYTGEGALSLAKLEALRASAAWRSVVRAKGFIRVAECPARWLTMQACGARIDVTLHDEHPAKGGGEHSQLVLIGDTSLDAAALRSALAQCEAAAPEQLDGGVAAAPASAALSKPAAASASTAVATSAAGDFASCVREDPRFEVCWSRDALVCFRMLSWLGVAAAQLNREIAAEANGSGCGSGRTLLLLIDHAGASALVLAAGAESSWADVRVAAERVMLQHFSGYYCGGCDCSPEALAAQAVMGAPNLGEAR